MAEAPRATKKSSRMWIWWVALLVVFAVAATLAVLKPWEPDALVAPTPSPSVTPSSSPSVTPSVTPSPAALTAETAVITNPATLAWKGDYTATYRNRKTSTSGEFPPFWPDNDYPGKVTSPGASGLNVKVSGAAPPWFPDMKSFSFVNGEAKDIGNGVAMDAYLVNGGFMLSTAADGTPTAWVIAAFNTDQHSKEPRWAICRFHLEGADATAAVDGVYCNQAESRPVGDTWAFNSFDWTLSGDTLVEISVPAWLDDPEVAGARGYTAGGGPAGVAWAHTDPVEAGPLNAHWYPAEMGFRVPSEREAYEAEGCTYSKAGELEFCPGD